MPREDFFMITTLEGKLKAAVDLSKPNDEFWLLKIKLVYDGEPAGELSFNLNGYDHAEAEAVARNIHSNDYLMREIDEYLWGESD
ncbi:hypothetical protein GSF27_02855 [Pseudomaricurvus sp. HS19]|nr:hypothetical protein [Pseudomaricurvus sp. HS19]